MPAQRALLARRACSDRSAAAADGATQLTRLGGYPPKTVLSGKVSSVHGTASLGLE
jgi:hypothetical protein